MKTSVKLAIASVGLILAMNAEALRQSPCSFSNGLLRTNGFTQNAIYTGAHLNQLLQDVLHVNAGKPFIDDMNYQTSYVCKELKGVAHGTLAGVASLPLIQADSNDNTVAVGKTENVVTVNWSFTR